jgi:hypothetical protein
MQGDCGWERCGSTLTAGRADRFWQKQTVDAERVYRRGNDVWPSFGVGQRPSAQSSDLASFRRSLRDQGRLLQIAQAPESHVQGGTERCAGRNRHLPHGFGAIDRAASLPAINAIARMAGAPHEKRRRPMWGDAFSQEWLGVSSGNSRQCHVVAAASWPRSARPETRWHWPP